MALSGNFSTNKYTTSSHGSIGLNLSWTGTQDVANNQTTIKWTLKSNGTMSSGYYVQGGPISAYINGTRVFYQSGRFNVRGDGGYKKTGTIIVDHNEDGSKNVAMSISAALYSTSQNCTGSKTFTLNKINRYAILESAPNFNDEDNPTITYNNYAGELVTSLQAAISVDGSTPLVPYRDLDISGNSYTFNLTANERRSLYDASTYSNSLTVYFLLKTELGGNTYVDNLERVMTIINADPIINNASYEDTNSGTLYITQDNQQIIQGHSILQFNFGELRAAKRAYLVDLSITIDGVTVSDTITSSSYPNYTKEFGIVNSSENVTAEVTLSDTRGNITRLPINVIVLSYSTPTAIITCARRNNFYNDTVLTVDASVSSLDNKNTMRIQYQYKEHDSQNWSSYTTIQDNTPTNINDPSGLDNTKMYDVRVRIQDALHTTIYIVYVAKGIPLVMFDKLKSSVGIDCLPSQANTLEVNGKIKTTGDTAVGGDLSVTGDIGGDDITASGSVSAAAASVSGNVNAGDVLIDNISVKPFYTTSERSVGKWIDGSTVYEKTVSLGSVYLLVSNTWIDVDTLTENIKPLDVIVYLNTAAGSVVSRAVMAQFVTSSKKLQLQNTRSSDIDIDTYTIRYIKTT